MGSDPRTTQYTLACPRCSGAVTYLESAAAVACPFCRGRFFLGEDGAAGWLILPRLAPRDAVNDAKRWLREHGHRITRIGDPEGLFLPFYWSRGRYLSWELIDGYRPLDSEDGLDLSPSSSSTEWNPHADVWEPRFQARSYARTLAAHPLSGALPGSTTRLGAQTLTLLDPDRLPRGFRLVEPLLSKVEAEEKLSTWLRGRERRRARKTDGPRASMQVGHRLNLVGLPVVLVPFSFRDTDRGAVLVDGLSGRALGEAPPDALASLPETDETSLPNVHHGTPILLPLECSQCGWELEILERDRLHQCPNCGSCWELVGRERTRVYQWFLDRPTNRKDHWLPFWVFGSGGGEDHLPQTPTFVPAYQGRHPQRQFQLAVRLTRKPPPGPWLSHSVESHVGASIGSTETAAWRWAVSGAQARETHTEFTRFLRTPPEQSLGDDRPAGLAWIPFRREGGDLVELQTGARTRAHGVSPWGQDLAA
jgi:DNA-directed RNA polymerase subunit RPC12/RpoP